MIYSTAEVAKMVGVSKNTILNWCNAKSLIPARDVRNWRVFSEDDIDMALELAKNITRKN